MDAPQIIAYLKRIPMCRELSEEGEEELYRLVPYVRERIYRAGERLLSEEHAPDRTIVITDGLVRLTRVVEDHKSAVAELDRVGPGGALGRVSLKIGDFRRVTAEAVDDTHVLYIYFRDLVRTYQKSDYLREHLESPLQTENLLDTLSTIPIFNQLTDRAGELELHRIAKITHEQYFDHGEWLFRQGEVSDRLIRVIEGQVELTVVTEEGFLREVGTLRSGDVAGETGLLVGDFHDVIATADGYARIIYILREEFNELLQSRPHLARKLNISEVVERRRRFRTFEWLRDDEWVVTIVQRHWTRLSRQVTAPAILLLLLILAIVALLVNPSTALTLVGALLLIPALGLIGVMVYQYINWRDDMFVLTTQRIVHIERVWPFTLQREETSLDNIEDIYEVRTGVLANTMDFGNLIAQTAGETVEIDMDYISHPGELRELISRQIGRAKARDILRMRGQIRELLARRLQIEEKPQKPEEEPQEKEQKRTAFLPFIILRSAREYLFPPAWSRAEQGDTIIWRRYWLPGFFRYSAAFFPLLLSTAIGVFLLGRILITSALVGADGGGMVPLSDLVTALQAAGFFGWFVIWLILEALLLGALLWLVEDWRNDYFQLTPSHIILVHRRPLLLQKSRRQARLDRIQNLSFEVPTIVARIFDYGHVQFETAGTEGQFVLQWVRRPEDVQETISARQYKYAQRQREYDARQRQLELVSWFTAYDELNRELGSAVSGPPSPGGQP
ncbi:MAG: cyclic nucleotide-binding domain-containing protein [Anaerolineae bacterium]